jgi:hypothetical protein
LGSQISASLRREVSRTFEGAATTGILKRIVAETLFDALAPFNALVGSGKGFQIEEGELKAKGFEGGAGDFCKLAFDADAISAGAVSLHLPWRAVPGSVMLQMELEKRLL